jgi:hypothetical protein
MVAVGTDVRAKSVGVAQFFEQGDGVVFDGGFVEGGHGVAARKNEWSSLGISLKGN